MICKSCGAETGKGKFCQYCGTQVSLEDLREQEIVNRKGCPMCQSTNVTFDRENQGEIRQLDGSTTIMRATVGVCRDCGYTWNTDKTEAPKKPVIPMYAPTYPSAYSAPDKNNLIWWILGWIFFFPAPVMVLIWRKKSRLSLGWKIGLTVLLWVIIVSLA